MEGLRLLDESARDSAGEPETRRCPGAGCPECYRSRAPRREEEEDVLLDGISPLRTSPPP